MKSKLLPALLLSIAVIAGTTTITDAFAQTNTENLETILITTSDTNDVVHMIMEALNGIIASITEVDEHVHELSDEVSMSTNTITSKLNDIEQTLSQSAALSVAMQQISSDVQSVKMTVEEIDEHVMALGDNSALETTISDLSVRTNTGLNTLAESIDKRFNDLDKRFNDLDIKLNDISTSLGVVQTTVSPDPGSETIPALMSYEENNAIKASYFATAFSNTNAEIASWPKGDSDDRFVLPYDFTFTCDQNVLIDKVSIEAAGPMDDEDTVSVDVGQDGITAGAHYGHPILVRQYYDPDTSALADIAASKITVAGRTLVNTNFDTGTVVTTYHQPADFELMQLSANRPLQFKSMINFKAYTDVENGELEKADIAPLYGLAVDGTPNVPFYPESGEHTVGSGDTAVTINTYGNLTAGNNTQLEHFDFDVFKVNVDYILLSGSNANCELSLPETTAALSHQDTILVNLVASGDGLIKSFKTDIDCNDKPVEITGLTASHDVNKSAVGAADLVLTAGGQSITFDLPKDPASNSKVTPADSKKTLPLKFDSGDLTISGKVPQVSGILLQVEYKTVSGNSCSEVQNAQ